MATSLTRVKGDVKANTIFDLTFDACQKCRKSNFSSRVKHGGVLFAIIIYLQDVCPNAFVVMNDIQAWPITVQLCCNQPVWQRAFVAMHNK